MPSEFECVVCAIETNMSCSKHPGKALCANCKCPQCVKRYFVTLIKEYQLEVEAEDAEEAEEIAKDTEINFWQKIEETYEVEEFASLRRVELAKTSDPDPNSKGA